MNPSPKRPTIALAMIVKNEEKNLPNLLDSVSGCFDQIYITDTGSTDKTIEIAKKYGCTIRQIEWPNDFAEARNESFKGITEDYIGWLDGDDCLADQASFIEWRDNVMGLGDYWMANYEYSHDETGKAICTFVRERVIRNGKGMKWKYFVHEGIVPEGDYGPIHPQFTRSFRVIHKRTAEDLQTDKMRNLRMFETHLHELDPRMRYYYGKELFEAQKPKEASIHLMTAASDSRLEPHDRLLAMQYSCFSLMQTENYSKAMEMAHMGLMLAPHRAEFHTIIGDCYLKLGKFVDAVPFFHSAMACTHNPGEPSAIFKQDMAYTTYPRNQLARIYANIGNLDQAADHAREAIIRYDNEESRTILAEIKKVQAQVLSYKNAKPCSDIVITTPPQGAYLWDGEIAKTKAMGGSETAAIEMAYWMAKMSGRKVIIFNPREDVKTVDGVEYRPISEVVSYFGENEPSLHIAWRHNNKLTNAPTFVWCHDLFTPGAEAVDHYDKILALTPFHKHYLMSTQGIKEEKIWVTRNGLKPERFQGGPWAKDPNKFVFSSSPDRGLDRTMRVLDRVREEFPDIKLHVFYGIEHLEKYGLGKLQSELKLMMEERKDWVVYHGATQQDQLMDEFKSAAYCVQPSDWIETSMISAMERACCGIFQIIRAVGGVTDTLRQAHSAGMAALISSDCITEAQHDLYAEEVKKAMREEAYKKVQVDAETVSWKAVSKEWLEILPAFARTSRTKLEDKSA